jgi:hypothetical protein
MRRQRVKRTAREPFILAGTRANPASLSCHPVRQRKSRQVDQRDRRHRAELFIAGLQPFDQGHRIGSPPDRQGRAKCPEKRQALHGSKERKSQLERKDCGSV